MENLNTSEILRQAKDALKQNPKSILLFLLITFLGSLISGLAGMLPFVGIFLSVFITHVATGMSMMKLESEALGQEQIEITGYQGFFKTMLALVLIVATFSILGGVIMASSIGDVSSEAEAMSVLKESLETASSILSIIMSVFYVLYLWPRIYIASKFNDYDNKSQKEIMNLFIENGLYERAFSLECSIFLEMLGVIVLYSFSMVLSIFFVYGLIFPILGLFIGTIFKLTTKHMLARIILFRDLSNQIELK